MDRKATIKKPILIACLAVLAAAVAGGAAFYVVSANEKQAQQEVSRDLSYALEYNFIFYNDLGLNFGGDIISDATRDRSRYTRVDFYDERPAGFDPEKIEDGVVVVFPSGVTRKSLDKLNDTIEKYGIDASAFGLGPEVTMYDMVHRRAEVQSLVDGLDAWAPGGMGESIRSKIYNPGIEIMPDLRYASDLNFAFYTRSGEFDGPDMIDKVWDDPTEDYTRVDYYDALPEGFAPEDIEDGAIMAVPTEKTQKSLDRLNDILRQYNIDPMSAGLGSEVTVYDAVHDPGAIQILFDRIQKASPVGIWPLRDSIRNPE